MSRWNQAAPRLTQGQFAGFESPTDVNGGATQPRAFCSPEPVGAWQSPRCRRRAVLGTTWPPRLVRPSPHRERTHRRLRSGHGADGVFWPGHWQEWYSKARCVRKRSAAADRSHSRHVFQQRWKGGAAREPPRAARASDHLRHWRHSRLAASGTAVRLRGRRRVGAHPSRRVSWPPATRCLSRALWWPSEPIAYRRPNPRASRRRRQL